MTTETPHRLLKERLRQERAGLILDVVEEVLLEKGYHEMSIDEVAARAGVAKGTLYQHFPSKSDLVFALFERNQTTIEQMIARVASTPQSPRAKLEAILHWVYLEQPPTRSHLFQTLYNNEEIRRILADKKAQLRERFEHFTTQIGALFEAGKAAGEFDPTIATGLMLTNLIYWMSQGRYRYGQLGLGDDLSAEQLAAQVSQIVFDGIAAKR